MIFNTGINYIMPLSNNFGDEKQSLPQGMIDEFIVIKNSEIGESNIFTLSNISLSESILDIRMRERKDLVDTSDSNNIELISFMTHSYDILDELLEFAKYHKTGFIYEYFEEGNDFAYRYYINKNGEFIEFKLEDGDFDKDSESILEMGIEVDDYYLEKLNFKVLQHLDSITFEYVLDFYPEIKEFNKDFPIMKIHENNYSDKIILTLSNNYTGDSIIEILDDINNKYKKQILTYEQDGTFDYIIIDKYEIMLLKNN